MVNHSSIPSFDPYACFMNSRTPVGLYARQKWLNQASVQTWQADFERTVALLQAGQRPDGSWDGSFLETVRRLFGLHLTVRYPTPDITRAIHWLFETAPGDREIEGADNRDLAGLPFAPGDGHLLSAGMTLFLATIFEGASHPQTIALYEWLSEKVFEDKAFLNRSGDVTNVLRALAVHPLYATSDAMVFIVEGLSGLQDGSGTWPPPLPFYLTVNALAHLDLPSAQSQLEKALPLLARTQNRDGTWGDTEQEWNTFLVVHSLKNRKIL